MLDDVPYLSGVFGPSGKTNVSGIADFADILEQLSGRKVLSLLEQQESDRQGRNTVEVDVLLEAFLVGLEGDNGLLQTSGKA